MNEFTQLTIDGITYVPRDNTKLPKPAVSGSDGQVLAKKGETTEWVTVSAGDNTVTDARVSLIEGSISELDQSLTAVEKDIETINGNISDLTETDEALADAIEGLESNKADKGAVDNLSKTVDSLSGDLSSVSANVDALMDIVGGVEDDLNEMLEEV